MIDPYIDNPISPKYHVIRYLRSIGEGLRRKTVLDIPAGNGTASAALLELGACVEAYDLFPEYFMLKSIECRRADIMEGIPAGDAHADMIVCQEGIEHFSDQLKAFREFNRVLKMGGRLLVTTPSYSCLSARLSYLLFESETARQMPPNEIDDIWMSDHSRTPETYHGHVFLIGLQKLRILAKLAGFRIERIRYVRLSRGSLLLLPLLYPFLAFSSWRRYRRCLKKHGAIPTRRKKEVYGEQLKINLDPRNLINRHSFVVFEKECELSDLNFGHEAVLKPFNRIM